VRFIDEAQIRAEAGAGGNGVSHFRREKYVPKGGPDGGDGGRGGSVVLVGDESLTTLVDFHYQRHYRARSGEPGGGGQRTGASGADLRVPVPVGTQVYNAETGELLGDVTEAGEELVVARGGTGGLGNSHFKSSTNRTPTQQTDGQPGEAFRLRLELRLLADVGLVGLPNAGKSSLVRALSNARPRVADYPFTTLQPSLGVVRVDPERSFVVADIPGLIAGAADGAGLGTRFLRQLARNHLLLHVVDIDPMDGSDPAENVRTVEGELGRYDAELLGRQRWLVVNKIDLLDSPDREAALELLRDGLDWDGPIYAVSAESGEGLADLQQAVMRTLEAERAGEVEP
jgi:GTP-binding protein